MTDYDLIIVGSGPGGYVAAIKAAQLGLKTAVIEEREVGGTCLNRGCVPTKTLVHTADLLSEIKEAEDIGINANGISFDIDKVYERKNEVVSTIVSGVEDLLKGNKVDVIRGRGRIEKPGEVIVSDKKYTCKDIIIATGSKPKMPPIEGLDLPNVVNSDGLLGDKSILPKSIVIVGGGVIGVEFASIYTSLGCKVTMIETHERVLINSDKEISRNLSTIMKKRGVEILTKSMLTKIEKDGDDLVCFYKNKTDENSEEMSVKGDHVLVAIGRGPNTEGLFGEDIANTIALNRGSIIVDEKNKTNIDHIYAIGDVCSGAIQLAHTASAVGINTVCGIAGKAPEFDINAVPSCIYTNPEIATVGMSADGAKEKGIEVKVGKYVMGGNAKTLISKADRSFIKVVSDANTNVILGAQMMCPRATDMINEFTTAIVNKLTVEEMGSVIRPHPTFCEGSGEAIEDIDEKAIHIMPKKKR